MSVFTLQKPEFDKSQAQVKSEIQSNEIAKNNDRENLTDETSNRETNPQSNDIIILSSDDEICVVVG